MGEDKLECLINKQKYAKNEVTNDVPRYFNIFKCGQNILNRLDVSYEKACMVTPRYEYYTNLLETLVNYNDRKNGPLSNKKIQQAVRRVMAETEEEERDAKCNANNVTMDTILNISMSQTTLDSTPIGFKNNCTISPSQGDIPNLTSVNSTISPSQDSTI